MGRNSERVSRANHKTNKRMSIFRYTQVRSYKTVPNDFFVELKRYFVTQGFKIKRFEYTETSGQMVGRKDGWHLNFVPKFILDIKQVNGVHFITFNYFARVRKIGIASGIATQGITALIGAATITGYLVAARNLVDAVGKAMDVLAGNPLSVEWVEKEEAGEKVADTPTTTSSVTYNTTNIQNAPVDPNANNNSRETNTVVEHHHHYYYGSQNEHAQPHPVQQQTTIEPALTEDPFAPTPMVETPPAPQQHQHQQQQARLAIMPAEPVHSIYQQCDLEKELIGMMERGDALPEPEYNDSAFSGAANASMYDQHQGNYDHYNHNNRDVMSSPNFLSGGARSDVHSTPAVNPFSYEDNTPVPQYNLPVQHTPLYSIEPLSYKMMESSNTKGLRLDEIVHIAPMHQQQQQPMNPFFDVSLNSAPKAKNDDPFADLSLDNIAGAYGMKHATHAPSTAITTADHGYARN